MWARDSQDNSRSSSVWHLNCFHQLHFYISGITVFSLGLRMSGFRWWLLLEVFLFCPILFGYWKECHKRKTVMLSSIFKGTDLLDIAVAPMCRYMWCIWIMISRGGLDLVSIGLILLGVYRLNVCVCATFYSSLFFLWDCFLFVEETYSLLFFACMVTSSIGSGSSL